MVWALRAGRSVWRPLKGWENMTRNEAYRAVVEFQQAVITAEHAMESRGNRKQEEIDNAKALRNILGDCLIDALVKG
jgi:hypothetical protein